MVQPGQTIGVAVSGGRDSVCLLHILREVAPRWRLRLRVLHLDHGLRVDSARDAAFVARLAEQAGLPFEMKRVRLEPGNLEARGREARLEFFHDVMSAGRVNRIATGHTLSDQAETVLFRLLRGAGGAGLAAIRPVTRSGLIRPLLGIPRADVTQYLQDLGQEWMEDSTNASPVFDRNRIRHQLLPQLEREWNPRLAEVLAHTADWAAEEEAFWETEIQRLAESELTAVNGGFVIAAERLASLPRAIGRRLVRWALVSGSGNPVPGTLRQMDQVLHLAGSAEGYGRVHLPGCEVIRSQGWIRLGPRLVPVSFDSALPQPGVYPYPGGEITLRVELVESSEPTDCVYNKGVCELDSDRVRWPLTLRSWRPGDRYQPVGHSAPRKLKQLFQSDRIPVWERAGWPVVLSHGEIIWARGFGPSAAHLATGSSRRIVRLREETAGHHGKAALTSLPMRRLS